MYYDCYGVEKVHLQYNGNKTRRERESESLQEFYQILQIARNPLIQKKIIICKNLLERFVQNVK